VVQDPNDAAFPDMPLNALNKVTPDHVVPLAQMPALLDSLARQPAGQPVRAPAGVAFEVDLASGGMAKMQQMDDLGRRSVLTSLNDDINAVRQSLRQVRATLARVDRMPYLAAVNGARIDPPRVTELRRHYS
jgi:hypothetical protein